MSSLRPHTVVPLFVFFIGFYVPASEGEARERHAGAQTSGAAKTSPHHSREPRSTLHKSTHREADHEAAHGSGHSFSGMASYYSESQHVASGEKFDPSGYTCAHPSLPFGTHLRVADPKSGRSVVVTVNDRGPFVHGRTLDLSLGAARALGMIGRGVMRVEAHVI
jgi:rare lipoprotein A